MPHNVEELINQAKAEYTTKKRQDELKSLQYELKALKPAYDQIKTMPAEEQAQISALEVLLGE